MLQALFSALATLALLLGVAGPIAGPAWAITAPEVRSQNSVQDLSPNSHGRDLHQQEFLKATLSGFDLSGADLRGAVFNSSDLQGSDLRGADLQDVVAFASRFDRADLRGAVLRDAMLMQSKFSGAAIEGADFTNAVLDLSQRRALCQRAAGVNPRTGAETKDSLECR